MQVRWLGSDIQIDDLVEFFLRNIDESFISHSEVMIGRASDPDTWSDDLADVLAKEFAERMDCNAGQDADRSTAVCALDGEKIIGILNYEVVLGERSSYLVLEDAIVDMTRRNTGIFTAMYEFLIKGVAPLKLKSVFAESGIGNHDAHKAIERIGLREISRVFYSRLAPH